MNLNNVKIGVKIAAAIIFVGLVGLTASLFASYGVKSVNDEYSQMMATRPRAILAVSRAARNINDMIGQSYKVIANPIAGQGTEGGIRSSEESFRTAIARAEEAAAIMPEMKAKIDGFVTEMRAIKTSVDLALAASANNETAKALELLNGLETKVRALVENIVAFSQDLLNDTDRRSKELGSSTETMIVIGVTLTVIGLLVGLGLSILMSSRTITRPLDRLKIAMRELATGNFDATIDGDARKDEVGDMARAVLIFKQNGLEMRRLEGEHEQSRSAADATRLQSERDRAANAREQQRLADEQREVMSLLAGGLDLLSRGDLTCRIDANVAVAYEKLRDDFNAAVARLSETVTTIQATSADVGNSAREINMGADDLSKRTEEQASSLEQTAATTEELAASVKASANASRQAVSLAQEAMSVAEKGGAIVTDAVQAMTRIETASQKIADIIRVIDDIAFQTNLLALNAAVEAARAGDAGKGFAVVASEVRTLAQRSSAAAKDISGLIGESGREVEQGVALVHSAGEALTQIVEASRKVSATVSDISAASAEQANGIDEMSQTVAHMDEMTQQNAALAEESAASATSLLGQIQTLNALVATFRTHGAATRQQAAPRRHAA